MRARASVSLWVCVCVCARVYIYIYRHTAFLGLFLITHRVTQHHIVPKN